MFNKDSYQIYLNIIKYLKYRNKDIPKEILTEEDVFDILNIDHILSVVSNDIIILLTFPDSTKYSILGSEGKKKIKEILSKNKYKELFYICDINYIGLKTSTSINTVSRILQDLKPLFPDTYISVIPYTIFELEIPLCKGVPKHKIITKEYVKKYTDEQYQKISSIPRIHHYDPPIVWLGAKKGDYIEIERPSQSVGITNFLRIVI